MRQSIQITGLDTQTFAIATENILKLHNLIARSFPEGKLQTWQPSTFLDDSTAIDIGNRYFTDQRDAADATPIQIAHSVDPQGILTTLMGQDFIHSTENEVQYFELSDHAQR
jgi:hypothetical protein